MRGIVVWYSRSDFKAVIWCEDSQALALATGATAWRNPMDRFCVGDYVSFTCKAGTGGDLRHCRDLHVIEAGAAHGLVDALQSAIAAQTHLGLIAAKAAPDMVESDNVAGPEYARVVSLKDYAHLSRRESVAIAS